jgi:hypothetical protein
MGLDEESTSLGICPWGLYLFLTKAPITNNGEKTASSTDAAGKSGYLHAEN